jgi:hypothetical protein
VVDVVKIPGRLVTPPSAYLPKGESYDSQAGGGIKNQASNYQKAWKIFSFLIKTKPYAGTVWLFYVDLGQSIVDFDGYAELLGNWRSRPQLLWGIFSAMSRFDRENMTNFSKYDWWLLFFEMININASNLVITEASKTAPGSITLTDGSENHKEEQNALAGKIAKVEVLNATDMKNAAKIATRFLRDKGFDVINFGNYSKNEKETRIIVWHGNISAAKRVRDAIDMNSIEIYSESNKFKIFDVTLIIGADFNKKITADNR